MAHRSISRSHTKLQLNKIQIPDFSTHCYRITDSCFYELWLYIYNFTRFYSLLSVFLIVLLLLHFGHIAQVIVWNVILYRVTWVMKHIRIWVWKNDQMYHTNLSVYRFQTMTPSTNSSFWVKAVACGVNGRIDLLYYHRFQKMQALMKSLFQHLTPFVIHFLWICLSLIRRPCCSLAQQELERVSILWFVVCCDLHCSKLRMEAIVCSSSVARLPVLLLT